MQAFGSHRPLGWNQMEPKSRPSPAGRPRLELVALGMKQAEGGRHKVPAGMRLPALAAGEAVVHCKVVALGAPCLIGELERRPSRFANSPPEIYMCSIYIYTCS